MSTIPFIDPAHEALAIEALEKEGMSETEAKKTLEFTGLLRCLVQDAKDRGAPQDAIAVVLYTAFLHESGQADPDTDHALKHIKQIITGGEDN